jgi:hypothetical protein
MSDGEDYRVMVCNMTTPTKIYTEGTKLYVVNPNRGNGGDHIEVYGRSRGGRWVHKWESAKRLGNFRFKTIPPEHPLYKSCSFFISTWLTDDDLTMLRKACGEGKDDE